MSENQPNFFSYEGAYKKVFIPNPPTKYAYMTSKLKKKEEYEAAKKEMRYTHHLHTMYPKIIANALNIDETNTANLLKLPILRGVHGTNDEYVFKKPIVQPVDDTTPGLYIEMCKIINILADHGFCFLDMKPENVGLLDGLLVIIDADVKYLYEVPEELKEYFRECGKLIALYNIMGTELERSADWTGLSPEELQKQFTLGLDYLLTKDLTLEQKEEIVRLNRLEIPEDVNLEFPLEFPRNVIYFYGNKLLRRMKKANPKVIFPDSLYKFGLNIPLELVGLRLDATLYNSIVNKEEEQKIKRKKELANYKAHLLFVAKSVKPVPVTIERLSRSRSRDRSRSRSRNNERYTRRYRNSNSSYYTKNKGFNPGLKVLKSITKKFRVPNGYQGFRF